MKLKSRKLFAILVITMLLLTMLPATALASVPAITAVSATSATPAAGATTSTWTIPFTVTGAAIVTPAAAVVVTFPVGFVLTGTTVPAFDVNVTTGAISVAARTVTFPIITTLPAATYAAIVPGVTNSTVAGTHTWTVAAAGLTATGTGTVTTAAPNRFASAAHTGINRTSVIADNTDTATVTAHLYDQFFNAVSGGSIVVASSRGVADTLTVPAATNAAGMTSFTVRSAISGSARIGVALPSPHPVLGTFTGDDLAAHLQGLTAPAGVVAAGQSLIAFFDVTFTAAPVTIRPGVAADFTTTPAHGASPAILSALTLGATVRSTAALPVGGQTVTFQRSFAGGPWSDIGTRTSGPAGTTPTITTTETVPGSYSYRAMVGAVQIGTTHVLTFTGVAPSSLAVVTADGNVARNAATPVRVRAVDPFGNNVSGASITWSITRPAGSAVPATPPVSFTNHEGIGEVTITPDVLGTYAITATVTATGISRVVTLTAVDLGAVTRLELSLPTARIALQTRAAGVAVVPALHQVELSARVFDAAGISRAATRAEITLASSNMALATVDPATFVITNPAATGRGLVTITAVHGASGQVASVRIPIVGHAITGMLETVEVDDLKAEVALQLVDLDVNPTFHNVASAFTVAVPAGVTVDRTTSFAAGTGRGSIALTAAEPGEYSITVATTAPPFVSRTFTVEFAAPPAPVIGAESVTMFIGARGFVQDGVGKTMDVAPFIENARTFVPVRFLAEAFGATADWVPKDAPVRTVTLTREDVTITINIGSPEITVLRGDVTTTVTADVAAFIRNGRTVLPFRAIAEAFGAEVDYGPKDAPIEWVSFKQ